MEHWVTVSVPVVGGKAREAIRGDIARELRAMRNDGTGFIDAGMCSADDWSTIQVSAVISADDLATAEGIASGHVAKAITAAGYELRDQRPCALYVPERAAA